MSATFSHRDQHIFQRSLATAHQLILASTPSFGSADPPLVTMSSCDCDRKNSNGGTCDSSCKEEETFGMIVENASSPATFAPVVAVSKAAGAAEIVSFEAHNA